VKKVELQTARVHWRMGQSLLPEHFYAQEESLRNELYLTLRMLPAPFWGVGSLSLDGFQLLNGALSIREMTLIYPYPSGMLIDVPGNTAPPATFNLNKTGSATVPIYVHLETEPDIEAPGDVSERDDNVERVVQRISLSPSPISDVPAQSFKLAEFSKAPDKEWTLSDEYIPPMIRVTHSPFFDSTIARMRAIATSFHQVLTEEIQESYLAGESLLALRQALRGLFGFQAFLATLGRDIDYHPMDLHRALVDLYLDICVLREIPPAIDKFVYSHEEAGPAFKTLLDEVTEQVRHTKTAAEYVPFKFENRMQVCELPVAAKKARKVFWLVQKPRVGDKIDLARVKLASENRVALVHQMALRGIPYTRIENPPFHHPFSAEVEFYQLESSEEWDHAVREGKIAFFHRSDFDVIRFFLYWRND
jgi:type VI secretion system protein ImpJ